MWLVGRRPDRRRQEIEAQAKRAGVVCEPAPPEVVAGLERGVVHNGFVARLRDEPEVNVSVEPADPHLAVLLEDIQDPRNLGALLRVCEGAGVASVSVRDRGSAPLSPAAIKTSAGAADWLDVQRVVNSARTIEEFQQQGYWIYGADAEGVPPWDLDLTGKVVLCFGGEERGLRARTRKVCDALVGLPMRGRVESLNVATAAAAILYEAVRQRSASAPSTEPNTLGTEPSTPSSSQD